MKLSLLAIGTLFLYSAIASAEWSAIIETELILDEHLQGEKFEIIAKPEWNASVTDEMEMTLITRFRFDGISRYGSSEQPPEYYSSINGPLIAGNDGEGSIREWYIDTAVSDSFLRIGKQQVVWGQADGLKVLDIINPQSFREFILDDFDESRIPLWMANVEIPIGDESSLQLLWIPDLTYNEFAEIGSRYQITSPLFVPQLEPGDQLIGLNQDKPSSVIKDSDIGIRYSSFIEGWDLTFNYLYHYHDSPVLYQERTGQAVMINSQFERNHLVGATASNVFGDFSLRTEIGYNSDTFHLLKPSSPQAVLSNGIFESEEFSSVIGLDWQGLEDTFVSVQWFQSYLFDYDDEVIRPRNNHIASFLYRQSFQNETWELSLLSLYGFDQRDSAIQMELSYLLEDNLKIWIGSDQFSGSINGLFGQFDNQDRIKIGFELGL